MNGHHRRGNGDHGRCAGRAEAALPGEIARLRGCASSVIRRKLTGCVPCWSPGGARVVVNRAQGFSLNLVIEGEPVAERLRIDWPERSSGVCAGPEPPQPG